MVIEGQNLLNHGCKLITAATFKLARCKRQTRPELFLFPHVLTLTAHTTAESFLPPSPDVISDNEM